MRGSFHVIDEEVQGAVEEAMAEARAALRLTSGTRQWADNKALRGEGIET